MRTLFILVVIVFLIGCQPSPPPFLHNYTNDGFSMQPTYKYGDLITVDHNYYIKNPLKRGDVIAMQLKTQNKPQIKRIIALPGDHLLLQNNSILINKTKINEPYIEGNASYGFISPLQKQLANYNNTIPNHLVLVMGDNRLASMDSGTFGLIPTSYIQGKVIIKYGSRVERQ